MAYQLYLIPGQFEGANMTLTVLKISYLEQLNSKILGWLPTLFSRLKIERLIKPIGIRPDASQYVRLMCK
ncbi:hypothetical protein CWC22_011875 [Pseudoalteromonas rubra]|uniref:Uncharacterized protein n=1 Tax=Pseudoalteromonas rubra TaxID=43658 RepID=A0A5S3UQT6_9GAMM|nr:hypothetical protein CWC22_011875 [Pseudoalteromonas rubra]